MWCLAAPRSVEVAAPANLWWAPTRPVWPSRMVAGSLAIRMPCPRWHARARSSSPDCTMRLMQQVQRVGTGIGKQLPRTVQTRCRQRHVRSGFAAPAAESGRPASSPRSDRGDRPPPTNGSACPGREESGLQQPAGCVYRLVDLRAAPAGHGPDPCPKPAARPSRRAFWSCQ